MFTPAKQICSIFTSSEVGEGDQSELRVTKAQLLVFQKFRQSYLKYDKSTNLT